MMTTTALTSATKTSPRIVPTGMPMDILFCSSPGGLDPVVVYCVVVVVVVVVASSGVVEVVGVMGSVMVSTSRYMSNDRQKCKNTLRTML